MSEKVGSEKSFSRKLVEMKVSLVIIALGRTKCYLERTQNQLPLSWLWSCLDSWIQQEIQTHWNRRLLNGNYGHLLFDWVNFHEPGQWNWGLFALAGQQDGGFRVYRRVGFLGRAVKTVYERDAQPARKRVPWVVWISGGKTFQGLFTSCWLRYSAVFGRNHSASRQFKGDSHKNGIQVYRNLRFDNITSL